MFKNSLKLLISIGVLTVIFTNVNLLQFSTIIRGLEPVFFLSALAVQLVLSVVQSERWRIILLAGKVRTRSVGAWLNVMIGLCFNQVLPSSVGGDAIRIYNAKSLGLGMALRSILIDRLIALFTLSILSFFICSIFYLDGVNQPHLELMLGLELLFIFSCVLLVYATPIVGKISGMTALNLNPFHSFSHQLKSVVLVPSKLFSVLSMSFVIHFFVSISAILLFIGVGVETDLVTLGAIFALINLFSVIPISFGGWGIREGVAFVLYPVSGVEIETVLAVSILFGVVMMIVGLIGGTVWLLNGDKAKELRSGE